jgi:cell division protein FtsW
MQRPYIPRPGHYRTPPVRTGKFNYRQMVRIWWREIDRVAIGLVLSLIMIGLVAVAAASPASARRLSTVTVTLPDLYFYWAHVRWVLLGLTGMFALSFLPRDLARRLGIAVALAMIGALLLVPLIGSEVNGARRWLDLGIRFQPSEFLKPAFAITCAWLFSMKVRDPQLPIVPASLAFLGLVVTLLMMQPNFGSAILFTGAWGAILLMSGLPMKLIGMIGAGGTALLAATYAFYDNARHRIDSFLGGGTAYDQVDLASRTLMNGGWTGTGMQLGTRKMSLPEAHTDYIFSVIGEEFGLLACAVIVLIYLALIVRVALRLTQEDDLFAILAGTGLIALIGGQAFINMMVNLQLFPSKGMTLPFISYGGSSFIALCMNMGLLLAITRRNPYLTRERFDLPGSLRMPGIGQGLDQARGALGQAVRKVTGAGS